ncbi:MAG: 30S ribosomal protein S17e [Sulfolobales archaeon]|nr:30S ribosomal protein S17e [Sulfolobales archaeon]MCX8185664.1 30S ribosomal protein S17e [Sulfolobales archaeon]MDW7969607.1 30S ribosomal protein S17e [Sulfolobales archaeon]
MGKVRTSAVKRTAEKLFEQLQDKVTTDFNSNKELVKSNVYVKSKKLRNQIAGYLTRLANMKLESTAGTAETQGQ